MVDIVRPQPDTLSYISTSKCCKVEIIDSSNEMMNCIHQSVHSVNKRLYSSFNESSNPLIVIVTYYTLNILESYASKSIATLAAYAEQNNYLFYPFQGPNTKYDYAPYDPRWNKIQILSNVLREEGLHSTYVVWVDADLIILDFGMKIEMIGSFYSDANIIISKDMEKATFISNSGFIIVKNSEWSMEFLQQWWSSYDRRKCCDQNVLTWLYDKMSIEEKNNIMILRSDALNTEFPCWKNLKSHNQVLHLAGATSLYRNNIFDSSLKEVCSAIDKDPPFLRPQLTVNREYLEKQMKGLQELRVNTTQAIIEKLDKLSDDIHQNKNSTCTSQQNEHNKIFSLRNRLNDVLKFDDSEDIYDGNNTLLANEILIREKLYGLLNTIIAQEGSLFQNNNCSITTLELIRETISMGFELAIAKAKDTFNENTESSLRHILLNTQVPLLQYFEMCSLTQFTNKVLYYKFKNSQLIADSYSRSYTSKNNENNTKQLLNEIIYYYKESLKLWNRMVQENYFGADYVIADPYKEGTIVDMFWFITLT